MQSIRSLCIDDLLHVPTMAIIIISSSSIVLVVDVVMLLS